MANCKLSILIALCFGSALGDQDSYEDQSSLVQVEIARHSDTDLSLLEIPGLQKNVMMDAGKDGGAAMMKSIFKNLKMPEKGFDKRLQNVSKVLATTCDQKMSKIDLPVPDPGVCNRTQKLVDILLNKVMVGPEPNITWTVTVQTMIALNYYLYLPGTMFCFQTIDKDGDEVITRKEMLQFSPVITTQAIATGLWDLMESGGGEFERNNNMTRFDLTNFVHAVVMLRDYLPEIDAYDPEAPTQKCMMMSQRILNKPKPPVKRLAKWPKLGVLFALMCGAITLHCVFCTGRVFAIFGSAAEKAEAAEAAAAAAKKAEK